MPSTLPPAAALLTIDPVCPETKAILDRMDRALLKHANRCAVCGTLWNELIDDLEVLDAHPELGEITQRILDRHREPTEP